LRALRALPLGSYSLPLLLRKPLSTRGTRPLLCGQGGIAAPKMPPEPARTRRRRKRRRHAASPPSSSRFLLVLSLLLASCALSLQQSDLAASAHTPPILAGKVSELVRGGGGKTRRGKGQRLCSLKSMGASSPLSFRSAGAPFFVSPNDFSKTKHRPATLSGHRQARSTRDNSSLRRLPSTLTELQVTATTVTTRPLPRRRRRSRPQPQRAALLRRSSPSSS